MDFTVPNEVARLSRRVDDFAADWVARHGGFDDCWMTGHSPAATRAVAKQGWIGMTLPLSTGGHGRSALERFVVIEALMSHGVPMGDWWFADQLIGDVLARYGTGEQQLRWIPDIVAGRTRWTIASAEPESGSDPMSMTTTAQQTGSDYLVNGTKMWVLGPSDLCYLVAVPAAGAARRMLELVLDLNSPGVCFEPIVDVTGRTDFGHLVMDDVRIPEGNLIPPSARGGIRLLRGLNSERGGIDRFVSNRAAYLRARSQADSRDPIVRQRIAKIEAGYRIGRLMALRTLLPEQFPGYPSLVKIFGSEFEQEVADFVIDVGGAQEWDRAARVRLYSTAYTMIGGASEVLRSALADVALKMPSERTLG